MKNTVRLLLLSVLVACSSCGKNKRADDPAFLDYAGRYLRMQHDYCSTNIAVAEEGLDTFRLWVLEPKNPCEPWMNRDLALFKVDARMFLIKEFLGETNMAEQQYHESLEDFNKYLEHLRSLRLPSEPHPLEPISSKEGLRTVITLQDTGLDVGWMRNSERIVK